MSIAISSTSGDGEDGGDVGQRQQGDRPTVQQGADPGPAPAVDTQHRHPAEPVRLADVRVFIGTDHAGLEFKEHLKQALADAGHEPVDCGAFEYDAQDDYPPFCFEVGERTVAEPGTLGVVIGGSGNGEQIAANKVPGVRAALVWNTSTAQLARQHNDANVVSIGARQHSRRRGDRARPRVPADAVQRRRAARPPDRPGQPTTSATGTARPGACPPRP